MPNLTIGDFWAWAYSDVISNANRSVFTEFMVGLALGATDRPRLEWDCVDFRYRGFSIEVKASAYINWLENRPSRIVFDIAKKLPWNAETNSFGKEVVQSADCYVFCVYPEKDRSTCNVLDIAQWAFYVLPTAEINCRFGNQKR